MTKRRTLLKAVTTVGASAAVGPWVLRHARAADEIRVASLLDLSGPIDLYGTAFYEGFTLAVEETNAAGGLLGRPVKVISYDTQSNNQLYAQFAERAAVQDKVVLLASQTFNQNFKLEIGSLAQQVVINDAPAELETSTGSGGTVICSPAGARGGTGITATWVRRGSAYAGVGGVVPAGVSGGGGGGARYVGGKRLVAPGQ